MAQTDQLLKLTCPMGTDKSIMTTASEAKVLSGCYAG